MRMKMKLNELKILFSKIAFKNAFIKFFIFIFHFNESGHSLADMKMIILEKVKKNDELYRKECEHYFIRKFNTYYYK